MERKRSTIQDYRGYLRRHLEPYFGDRPIDRIDADQITGYLKASVARAWRPRRCRTTLTSFARSSPSR